MADRELADREDQRHPSDERRAESAPEARGGEGLPYDEEEEVDIDGIFDDSDGVEAREEHFDDDAEDRERRAEGRHAAWEWSEKWHRAHRWQRRRLVWSVVLLLAIFVPYIVLTSWYLAADKEAENDYWETYMEPPSQEEMDFIDAHSKDAAHVSVAFNLEQVQSVDLAKSNFTVMMNVAYRWQGHDDLDFTSKDNVSFYKGDIADILVLDEYHEGGTNYQYVQYIVTINKDYWTVRFPLESHQLRLYLEPSYNINRVVFETDERESYVNPNLAISGYELTRWGTNIEVVTDDHLMMNPLYDDYESGEVYTTEAMLQLEINRSGIGVYLKCTVAMFGTLGWILLCLYVATFRHVNALGMVGSAFFGAVSNILVGANMLSSALQLGLVEFVNLFGLAIIVASTAVVIAINTIRNERENESFAQFYGRVMLVLIGILMIGANLALPLCAYL